MSDSYTPTQRARVRRLHDRAHYDKESIHAILDAGMQCHVGYVIDGQPYVTHTIHWREGDDVYFHGSSASRMLRTASQGVPVCLTVSFLDGLVLARSGFHCSVNYRSAMLFGTATAVQDEDEKMRALHAFVEGLIPGHWPNMRAPTGQEMKATTVCRLSVEEASAKIRTGPPKEDEEDYALDCWAGELPMRTVVDAPVRDPRLAGSVTDPEYLQRFRHG